MKSKQRHKILGQNVIRLRFLTTLLSCMCKFLLVVLALFLSRPTVADTMALHYQAFNQQLEEFAKDTAIDRYDVTHLSEGNIHIVLWYKPGEHFSNEELSAHTDGVCFGMLKQAIQAGARPFLTPMSITCEARQADSELPNARGHALGQSHYDVKNDTFVYSVTPSSQR
ncbi:hypothetical protein [Phytohalomonas tamaricis]|uniref:hypothetical protein n=1 Tax=Phytohalomonas tamaricis TaxID=2081032 RepID=UPI001319D4CA|nr:hypothetical protein [Phytohalomonas tamaricis]